MATNEANGEWTTVHLRPTLSRRMRGVYWWIGAPAVLLLLLLYLVRVTERTQSRPSLITQLIIVVPVGLVLLYASRKTRIQASMEISEAGIRWSQGGTSEEIRWPDVVSVVAGTDRIHLRSRDGKSAEIDLGAVAQWPKVRMLLEAGTRHVGWLPTAMESGSDG